MSTTSPPASRIEGTARVRLKAKAMRYGWPVVLVLEVALVLVAWEVAVVGLELWNPRFVPAPSMVFSELVGLISSGAVNQHAIFTAQVFALGFFLAAIFGVALGLSMGGSDLLEMMFGPFVWTVYAIPRIALAPLFVIWLGLGASSKVALVFLMAVFPILINTMEGVRTVPQPLIRAAQVFGAGRREVATKVLIPSLLPLVLVGLRIAVVRGFIGAILAEFVGSFRGLGVLLQRAAFSFETARSLAVVVILIVMAQVSMGIISGIKRLVAPWHTGEAQLD